ncbi:MAG: hypothetical protein LBG15_03635 [Dysgonamonadaceae bacterium]|jgi:uncharacterized protein (TIGR02145 family)|nr:hypothetical protein [Dysgonamonadaceae bacterium]
MKRKMIFLALTLFIWSAASVKAQVTIGSIDDPDPSAVLDLKTNDQGLLLPRVALVSTSSYTPLESHVAGMMVYNTAVSGSGTMMVTPGIYTNNGSNWIRMAEGAFPVEGAPQITTQPALFTFSRMQDAEGDPYSNVTSFSTTLTVVATGDATLKYQWYQKPKNNNGPGVLISGATSASYIVNIPEAGVDNWGLYSYYCVISNAKGSVISDVAEVALGCGAKTISAGWLSFMCHNLGADQTLDPFVWYSVNDSTSYDIKGWLFQWDRQADGHQWRSSDSKEGPYTGELDANGQIPPSRTDYYGKFVRSDVSPYYWRSTQYNNLWSNNPCPAGWHLVTQNEWGSILNGGTVSGTGYQAKANRWSWIGYGYQIQTNSTTTLFLPTTGYRTNYGASIGSMSQGFYWIPNSGNSLFYFHSDWIQFNTLTRASGFAFRCIAD